ncbi:MAG TPA: hypothetical protein VGC75_02945 [Candidatus Nitrosocosmicus sp.]
MSTRLTVVAVPHVAGVEGVVKESASRLLENFPFAVNFPDCVSFGNKFSF